MNFSTYFHISTDIVAYIRLPHSKFPLEFVITDTHNTNKCINTTSGAVGIESDYVHYTIISLLSAKGRLQCQVITYITHTATPLSYTHNKHIPHHPSYTHTHFSFTFSSNQSTFPHKKYNSPSLSGQVVRPGSTSPKYECTNLANRISKGDWG